MYVGFVGRKPKLRETRGGKKIWGRDRVHLGRKTSGKGGTNKNPRKRGRKEHTNFVCAKVERNGKRGGGKATGLHHLSKERGATKKSNMKGTRGRGYQA